MKIKFAVVILSMFIFASCKKEPIPIEPDPKMPSEDNQIIIYKKVNLKNKASDQSAMNVDINDDGTIDYSFFSQYVVRDGEVQLWNGVNPVLGSSTISDEQNMDAFLNMGSVVPFESETSIKEHNMWRADHAVLSVRNEAANGHKTYKHPWSDGKEKMMALKIFANGKFHYGWARLKFDRTTEIMELIDYAWNTNADEAIKIGAK